MKIFFYILIGVAAIALMTLIVFNYDPKTETWGSLLIGALFGYLLYKMPAMIRKNKQKNAK